MNKEEMREIGISHEYKFEGRIVKMRVDTVKTPKGNTSTREIVEHPGGVGIVALDSENRIYMEWQYRRPFDDVVYEIPAGKLEKGEEPLKAAIRELEEEVGLKAKNWVYLGPSYATPGFCTEILHIYLATDLYEGEVHRDPDEVLLIEKLPVDTLVDMAMSGEIKDGKSLIGILKTKEYLKRNKD